MLRHLNGPQVLFGLAPRPDIQAASDLKDAIDTAFGEQLTSHSETSSDFGLLGDGGALTTPKPNLTAALAPPPPYRTNGSWIRPQLKALHHQDALLAHHVLDLAQMEGPTRLDSCEAIPIIARVLKGESYRLNVYLEKLHHVCDELSKLHSSAADPNAIATAVQLENEVRHLARKKHNLMKCLHELYDTCYQLKSGGDCANIEPFGSREISAKPFFPWHPWRFCEEISLRRSKRTDLLCDELSEHQAVAAVLQREKSAARLVEQDRPNPTAFVLRCPVRPGRLIEVANRSVYRDLLVFFERHRQDIERDLMPLLTTQIDEVSALARYLAQFRGRIPKKLLSF